MFVGEYYHQIDEKNRLRIPSKIRKSLGECTIVKGSEGCLYILPASEVSKIMDKIDNIPMYSPAQKSLRMIFSSAFNVEEDSQGRFLLPASLKAFASITKDVVFIGVGNRCELWAQEKWTKYNEMNNNDFDNLTKELSDYGV